MSDNVTLSSEEEELTRTEIPFIVLYVLMCVIAVLGNSLTVYVVLSRRRMRNVTNYFIASLAVSDVLMALICIPFTFVANIILNWWPFGSIMCSVVTYLQAAIVFQNAYTLLAMSMERYIAIMHPFMRRLGKRRCLQLVALCWVLAFLTPIPTAITSRLAPPENYTDPDKPVCLEDWESKQKQFTYSLTIMILQYFVPLAVLIYTYAQIVRVIWLKDMPTPAELIQQNGKEDDRINRHNREPDPRKKVIKMMITVVGIYGFCWLPLHLITIATDVHEELWDLSYTRVLWISAHFLAMSNCVYNPFIYWWMNPKFREGYVSIFKRFRAFLCFCCLHNRGRNTSLTSLNGRRYFTKYGNGSGNNLSLSRFASNTQMMECTGVFLDDTRKCDSLMLSEHMKIADRQAEFSPKLSKISEVTENGLSYYSGKPACNNKEDFDDKCCRT
ncbi:RYamide receptor-like [Biomphalaria glabrata]|uniref:RYamide receptor-like n=1 Tax=Biomphalaria glabrata TaxID=6526 RepID=A0A9W2ZNV3_BIOGL|nr:RYamide receptor-like [Biomphalaria glabrata]XP_055876727.1 RYamide receptor-like [Biomphalaria glabrata]XP_055876728.1 RYamide receptor-like [Biomphalaria glabrata]XP_055876729.1 RYamide receptor-like [Biomphalaria glabrata]XP_055876730.1 RYamide receptor-like [Biomphalaria glabrata]XP_055876731.1 RYamide receptor-like [Biomphalaria glabrata]XP_055876732.1 RYamide receptor-like [Biomphalaria glabrata]XP_055876733.1 RYamide receptor-like [Biomphalaria glabrata]XP_055876734.1 RYamide rece